MKIALIGYGKMGKIIEELAPPHEVILKIDVGNLEDFVPEKISRADVAIEFTSPASAVENIKTCLEAGLPVVSGTTGWLDRVEEVKALVDLHGGAFLYASNFSVGMNLFFALNRQLAKWMNKQPDYEVAIEEIHHTQKLDAPSGTAISLANDLIARLDRKREWVNESSEEERKIGIVSKRIDNTPGTHIVKYTSAIDDIELKHTAHSREGFAKGALLAAEWVIGKKGVFGMTDVLGF